MSEYNDSFGFPYKILTKLGLWVVETRNPLIRAAYHVYQTWAIFFLIIFVSCCFWDLYNVRNNIRRASNNLSSTVTVFLFMWKNTLALLYYPRIRNIRKGLSRFLDEEPDPENHQILLNATREIKITKWVMYTLGVGTITIWLFFVFLRESEGEKQLPLPVSVPWDYQESPWFELAFFFQAYGGYFVACDVISLNLTIFGTTIQIGTEYDILMRNTRKIRDKLCDSKPVRAFTETENIKAKIMLAEIIRHHQKIIYLVNEAEHCYVHMMLVQFVSLTIIITVICLDLILSATELNSKVIISITFFALTATDMHLLCGYGTRLIFKSYEFLECISGTPWEAMNASNRKSISLIILKAQRPPRLTVEKMANIDRYTFITMGKYIYNFLYLLLQLTGEK